MLTAGLPGDERAVWVRRERWDVFSYFLNEMLRS